MINLYAKFEVSMFTQYEDMKGYKKCKIEVVWGLGVIQGHRQHNHLIVYTTSYSTLIDASILYRFRVIASYSSKVADFNLPNLHLAPP